MPNDIRQPAMVLSEPVHFPERYAAICDQFLAEYWHDRSFEMEQNFGYVGLLTPPNLRQLMVANLIADIARAAAGEITDRAYAGEIHEGVQEICERLFAAPGAGSFYHVPEEWWESPFGAMVARALLWCQGDELITIAEAARIAGVSPQAIQNRIASGALRAYVDPDVPGRQGHRLVARGSVEKDKN